MIKQSIILIVASFLVVVLHHKAPEELRYPVTVKGDTIDTYYDTTIADPYRWLEDDYSNSTKSWVTKQNAFTSSYLKGHFSPVALSNFLTDWVRIDLS